MPNDFFPASQLQLTQAGQFQHLLTLNGLSNSQLLHVLKTAQQFVSVGTREIKKVPLLRGKSVFNLFFENSTRTRTTFEIAAKRLSADVINININTSSTSKGESLLDTIQNLCAMHADIFVVRHAMSGAPYLIAQHVAPHVHVINAGDGKHAHPTQGLLDLYTIYHHKCAEYHTNFAHLKIAIVGDILHSRVARSDIHGLLAMGCQDIRLIGPKTLLPNELARISEKITLHNHIDKGLNDVDVIIMLRLQNERMSGSFLASSTEYRQQFGLTSQRLNHAKADAIVMHPGPINRGVEIDSDVADGEHSVILQQVEYGIAVRMAVMSLITGHSTNE